MMVDSAFTALHPLQLPAAARRLVVMNDGACAHLTDGRLACWQDLGPQGEVPVVGGGIVFRDVARRVAITADGTLGVLEPADTPAAAWRWRPLARDSALQRVFPMQGPANRHVCGLASGGALRCAGDFGAAADARVVPVVDAVTGAPIVVTAGRLLVFSAFLSQTRVHWIDATGQEFSGTLDAGPQQAMMATWPLAGVVPVGSTALRVERPDGTTPCRGFDGDPFAGCRPQGWRALTDWGTITGRTSGAGGGVARICHRDVAIICVTRVNVGSVGDPREGTIVDTLRVR
jgi:hypothetical protein